MIWERNNKKEKSEDRNVGHCHSGDACLVRSSMWTWTFILHEKEQRLVWSVSCQGTAGAGTPLITFSQSSAAPVIRDRSLGCPLISSSSSLQVPCAITWASCKKQAHEQRLINVIPQIAAHTTNTNNVYTGPGNPYLIDLCTLGLPVTS